MSTINVYNYFENETYNWFFSTHGILKGGHIFNSKSLSLSAKEAQVNSLPLLSLKPNNSATPKLR